MAKIDRVQEVSIDLLRPYPNNAKIHGEDQVNRIADSIKEFGFISPCLIDREYNLIAGHGRVAAAKKIGLKQIPCVFVEGLTEAQRKAYILADNRLTELGEWDWTLVNEELADIDIDMSSFGFELKEDNEWFSRENRWDNSREEGNDEYNDFLDKFEQPKTTDDCYTPDNIYDAVADYVVERFGVNRSNFVRPFYPGGDYKKENYQGKIVVDNPPFSILAEICGFYVENGVPFFLFAPSVSCFGYLRRNGVTSISVAATIIYENGAMVMTSFLTNLFKDGTVVDNDPDLYKKIETENKKNQEKLKANLPKYDYPYDVLTSSRAGWLSKYGERIVLKDGECCMIRQLDAQKESGSAIYGAGLLLSERAAAERAAAERAAAERAAAERAAAERAAAQVFTLSEREKEIQRSLR